MTEKDDDHIRKEDIPKRMQVTLCTLKIVLSFKHATYMLSLDYHVFCVDI